MGKAAKINLEIPQGRTFSKTLRWGQPRRSYRQITGITAAAPCVLTAPSHGVPDEWAFRISNVKGMAELNQDRYYQATVLDDDTIELNDVNAVDFRPYQSGGIITFNTPVDLAGMSGRMQARPAIDSTEVLLDLTTDNGGILLDNVAKTITLQATAMQTAAIDWHEAIYDLEMVNDSSGRVDVIAFGLIKVFREVTREP